MSNCRFYDDGHGNGSYIPGASCGPPSCGYLKFIKHKSFIPKCSNDLNKCKFNKEEVLKKNK